MSQRAHKLLRRVLAGLPVSHRVKREYYRLTWKDRTILNRTMRRTTTNA